MWRLWIAAVLGPLTLGAAAGMLPVQAANASPSIAVVLPENNATLSGTQYLDAVPSSGVTQVQYELTGGSLSNQVIATATPSSVGYVAVWDTTTVANGTYTLNGVASYSGGVTATSSPISITVNNAPPSTTVLVPSSGATQDTAGSVVFDASASAGVTHVSFTIGGDCGGLVFAATHTIVGWIAVEGGSGGGTPVDLSCTVQSVASYAGGVSGSSSLVPITVIAYRPTP